MGWFCGAQYIGDTDLRTELEKDLGKPQKLRQGGAGCRGNYPSGEQAGQQGQSSSPPGEEASEFGLLTPEAASDAILSLKLHSLPNCMAMHLKKRVLVEVLSLFFLPFFLPFKYFLDGV